MPMLPKNVPMLPKNVPMPLPRARNYSRLAQRQLHLS
jgi:hypothetical protein